MSANTNGHDMVVIGASAGGVEALTRVVGGLPSGFAGAVLACCTYRVVRGAARIYGRRVVGVVLAGKGRWDSRDQNARWGDGRPGPAEALFAGMPQSALRTTEVDHGLTVDEIPTRLVELTRDTEQSLCSHGSPCDPMQGCADLKW